MKKFGFALVTIVMITCFAGINSAFAGRVTHRQIRQHPRRLLHTYPPVTPPDAFS